MFAGLITREGADPQDWKWWQRTKWARNEMSRRDQLFITAAQQQHWMALLGGHVRGDLVQDFINNAAESLTELTRLTWPWLTEQQQLGSVDTLVDEFHEVFGKPGSEQYEKNVAQQRALLEKYKRRQRRAGS